MNKRKVQPSEMLELFGCASGCALIVAWTCFLCAVGIGLAWRLFRYIGGF